MDKRPNKVERIFLDLLLQATFVTCQRNRVASALVTADYIPVLFSRNGAPIGQPHCIDVGADPNKRCEYCIHSEKNLINLAAKMGLKIEGLQLLTLYRPCIGCSNDIIQAGIKAVEYLYDYDTDMKRDYVLSMYGRASIYIHKVNYTPVLIMFKALVDTWRNKW